MNMRNNQSRYAFTHLHESVKGQWLQWTWKKAVSKSLFFFHGLILKLYDKDAYVFDDYRLKAIKEFTQGYFKENMEQRKQGILNSGVDIFLFIMKEDIFYRARFFDMMQRWNRVQAVTGVELQNLDEWKGK